MNDHVLDHDNVDPVSLAARATGAKRYGRELAFVERVIVEAGTAARQVQERSGGRLKPVSWRDHREPTTQADLLANEIITRAIKKAFPGDGIVSEEVDEPPGAWDTARTWTIDPIDGTTQAMQGLRGWTVMVGLIVEGEPTVGAVLAPWHDRLWSAVRGGPASEIHRGKRRRIRVSRVTRPEDIRILFSRARPWLRPHVAQALGTKHYKELGSIGMRSCMIARGSAEMNFRAPGRGKLVYDTAPGQVIVEAAGGRFTGAGGTRLVYGPYRKTFDEGLLASNGLIHHYAVERLRDLPKSNPKAESKTG